MCTFRLNAVMKFHILAKEEDAEELNSTIEQMLQLGKLGSFDFDHNFQDIYSEPGYFIFSLLKNAFLCIWLIN